MPCKLMGVFDSLLEHFNELVLGNAGCHILVKILELNNTAALKMF